VNFIAIWDLATKSDFDTHRKTARLHARGKGRIKTTNAKHSTTNKTKTKKTKYKESGGLKISKRKD